jgi:hypothetical protein
MRGAMQVSGGSVVDRPVLAGVVRPVVIVGLKEYLV